MKKNILRLTLILAVFGLLFTFVPPVLAADGLSGGIEATKTTDNDIALKPALKTITNVLMFVIGAVAVIMIIIGGIRYVTSNGDSGAITSAKNTILYAVIGIIVAVLAYAIVNFVVDSFVA